MPSPVPTPPAPADGRKTRVDPAAAPARDPRRWEGVARPYGKADVERLRGSVPIEYTLARLGAERLWELMHTEPYVNALGALSGGQAVQMVRAGLKAIYLSGWQVAADANSAGQTYPDQSLYPADSVPTVVRRLNAALQRVDQIEHAEGRDGTHWFAPIVADAEAGFGGPLNAFELMKAMIEAGAAGVHFEDQVAAEKKCGHLGGKVLVPTATFVRTLTAARLAADVMGVPTLLVARTDAESATLIMSDVDPQDAAFVDRSRRTPEGFYGFEGGLEAAIARGIAYAPHADVVWCETQTPELEEARRFAEAIHARHPGKLLAYNCSPSFNWRKHLDDATIARFQRELGAMGYKFQFVTLAGFHALNHSMFQLARGYRERGMSAYSELQQAEFAAEPHGYTATRHQREVGVGYFDAVATVISGGASSTLALAGSTEAAQFAGAGGAAPPPEQVVATFDDDHARLKGLLGRLDGTSDVAALSASLDELDRMLTEHFADEEHAAGFYVLVGAREPRYRSELAHLIEEHRRIRDALADLVERTRGPGAAPSEIARQSGELASMLLAHEAREVEMAKALA
jgi:isocitrate lyase